MRRVITVGIAVLTASFVLFPPAAHAKTRDPCKLLKRAQIAKVFGQKAGPPDTGEPPPLFEQCYWNLEATDGQPAASIGTTVQTLAAKSTFEVNRESQFAQDVPSIKDAYYDSDLRSLNVLRGDVLLGVQLIYFDGEDVSGTPPEPELVRLTKAALKRLRQ